MRIPRPSRWAVLAALVAACAAAPSAATAPGAPPRVASVRALTALDRAFGDYADHNPSPRHWTGGDSTYSVRTAAGELWVFSDTFLGRVRPDGSRPPVTADGGPTPFVHNSFVLVNGSGVHTVTGRDAAGRPASLIAGRGREWYWARAGLPAGRGAEIVYARYARTGGGPLDVAWRGNVLASFRSGRLDRPDSLTALPSTARIAWGAWVAPHGRGAYVYGTRAAPGGGSSLYLARTSGPGLRGAWSYRTGRGTWSRREADAARLTGPGGRALRTSEEISVVRHGRWYALLTQRVDQLFSSELELAWSRSPDGPFGRPGTVFRAPEAGPYGSYHNARVIAYNPHEHPELEHGAELVVSYNVNSLDPADVLRRADLYRPRFLRLGLTR
ncbi:hypothetical protein [Streptomyces orinoci]|uniref:DUF4185 domain-containing protein n=1 Tax=Streptomyces orinoci TaxID=67339 RepID=A0ABV3K9W4_STRON|nr:hypothetical protein [Streptomyces orinoci]